MAASLTTRGVGERRSIAGDAADFALLFVQFSLDGRLFIRREPARIGRFFIGEHQPQKRPDNGRKPLEDEHHLPTAIGCDGMGVEELNQHARQC